MLCRDHLFLPSLLQAAGNGQLRVFGDGKNKVSFTYLDNYCHGLILGYDALYKVRAVIISAVNMYFCSYHSLDV